MVRQVQQHNTLQLAGVLGMGNRHAQHCREQFGVDREQVVLGVFWVLAEVLKDVPVAFGCLPDLSRQPLPTRKQRIHSPLLHQRK